MDHVSPRFVADLKRHSAALRGRAAEWVGTGISARAHWQIGRDRQIRQNEGPTFLCWLKVQIGTRLRMITVEEINQIQSDPKNTLVA